MAGSPTDPEGQEVNHVTRSYKTFRHNALVGLAILSVVGVAVIIVGLVLAGVVLALAK